MSKMMTKILQETIKQTYEDNYTIYHNNCDNLFDCITLCSLNVYSLISSMYENSCIDWREYKLLDRYNDRLKNLYRPPYRC